MKATAIQKANAYGFRKEGTKVILEILDSAQGYSRKSEVLERLAAKQLKSEQKYINGFKELESVGFIKIIETQESSSRIKLEKRLWEREIETIKLEHELIEVRLNENARWLNKKNIIRNVRSLLETATNSKQPHYSVEVHLEIILAQSKYETNESGLIRLSNNYSQKDISTAKSGNVQSQFPFTPLPNRNTPLGLEPNNISDNGQDEIDFDLDEDIFTENAVSSSEYDNSSSSVSAITENVFGGSVSDDIQDIQTENLESAEKVTPIISASNKYLEIISQAFSEKGFDISENFNELILKIHDIIATVSYDPSRLEILITSSHELENIPIIDALRLFGKADMIGQIAIDSILNRDFLLIKKRILTTRYQQQEVVSMIEKIIYEAFQLNKLRK